MEARPRSAMLALAMLVGQVAGFSQFPGAAPEEEGRSSRSSFDGTTGNLVIPNAPGVGKWGGTCVCPGHTLYFRAHSIFHVVNNHVPAER